MNLEAFYIEYQKAVERMTPWLRHAQERSKKDHVAREDFGYALEQLLIRRDRAMEEAEANRLTDLVRQIRELDARLLGQANSVREVLGVDVRPFLEELLEGPRAARA